jgi:hypothetical protein
VAYKTTLKKLSDCSAKELIRVQVQGNTEWAIVGAKGDQTFFVAILSGENAPRCINISGMSGLKLEYSDSAALSYGSEYELLEQHDRACEVASGPLSSTVGSVILTEKDRLLCCTGAGENPIVYFSLVSGEITSSVRGNRAAFAEWILWPQAEERGVLSFPPIGSRRKGS